MQKKYSENQLLKFSVQNVQCAIDLQNVDRVMLLPWIEKLPQSPDYVAGLMNIAGTAVSAIDLATELGIERQSPYTLSTKVILCRSEQQQAGFIVDQVSGLLEDAITIQMEDEFSKPESPFLGIVTVKGETLLILNPQKLLSISMTGNGKGFNFNHRKLEGENGDA